MGARRGYDQGVPLWCCPLLAVLLLAVRSSAQELFQRDFGPLDGLAHERVNAILEDPRGYLWVATWEGLSRFDGRSFVNYGTSAGLAVPLAFTLATDPEGRLWVAPHAAGVARLEEQASGAAARFRSFSVERAAQEENVNARVRPRGALALGELEPRALLQDSRGWLWIGTRHAGVAYTHDPTRPELVFERLSSSAGLPSENVLSLAEDALGHV